jgi:hypothetical protein
MLGGILSMTPLPSPLRPYRYGDSNPGFRTEKSPLFAGLLAVRGDLRATPGTAEDQGNSVAPRHLRLFAVGRGRPVAFLLPSGSALLPQGRAKGGWSVWGARDARQVKA